MEKYPHTVELTGLKFNKHKIITIDSLSLVTALEYIKGSESQTVEAVTEEACQAVIFWVW